MNKLHCFALFLLAMLGLAACDDEEEEFAGMEGRDHFISDFTLTVGGITYQATIAGDKITVELPYNASLEGAAAAYVLSEGASINPDPAAIQDWENEWKFVVTSRTQDSRVYFYTYRQVDIEQCGSVALATQADVDNFAKTGINKIDGNLTIGTADGEEITDLNGLAHLKQISNSLIIRPSYKGADLSGLDNLEQLGSLKLGSIAHASENTALKAVRLPALLNITGDFVINSSVIEEIAVPKAEAVGEDVYIASDALLSLEASALSSVGSSLIVRGSVAQKETAPTEAIVFSSLKRVGGDLAIQYFPKLQGAYLPVLENVDGSVSFFKLSVLGSVVMAELRSIKDLTVENCVNLSVIDLSHLVSSGGIRISGTQVSTFNISSLTEMTGDMYLGTANLRELDVSAVNFNGNTLSIYACDILSKITGPETFHGNFYLNYSRPTEFAIEGVSNIQGDFDCMSYSNLKSFVMPFVTVTGNMTVKLRSNDAAVSFEFPNLKEVGGLYFESPGGAAKVDFPVLRTIGNSCRISSDKIEPAVSFASLESIGAEGPDNTATFVVAGGGGIECPKLKTIEGTFKVLSGVADWGAKVDKLSFAGLEKISNSLIIAPNAYDDGIIKSIDFSNLKSVKRVEISKQSNVSDFSSFRYLFENGVLTEESQWSVTGCAYNPTCRDMKAGRYRPAEQ